MSDYTVNIKAGRSEKDYWKDLWQNKQLLWILAKRDVSVRYKQTALGLAWSAIRPMTTMVVMTFVFNMVADLKGDPDIPYPMMILGGITIWTLFASTFTQISNSITLNSNLVSKVYFPRLIMPLSAIGVGLIDFLITLGLFVGVGVFHYGLMPSLNIIFLPFFVLLTVLTSMGFGLFFSVVNVRFRDIGQLVPFIIQVGYYACPIAYSSRLVESKSFYWVYNLNPMVGIIDGFRWCILGDKSFFNIESLYSTITISLIALFLSVLYFRSKENTFVDHI
jgi:lipopolysaccharide transport system permease protein